MAKERLIFGKLDGFDLIKEGSSQWIRIDVDSTVGSNVLTNVADNRPENEGFDKVKVGQRVRSTQIFNGSATITAIDFVNNTITCDTNAISAQTERRVYVTPPKGAYIVRSASIDLPNNVGAAQFDFRYDFTGSHDSDYDTSKKKFGIILAQQEVGGSSRLGGEYAQYEVSNVIGRHGSTAVSFYVTSSITGILGEETNKKAADQTSAIIFQTSYSSSLAPIIEASEIPTPAGYGAATYRAALQEYYDDLRVGIYHSSSLIEGNADFINFTGSAVKSITTSSLNGQNGVLIELEGGGGDTFPYTGSAEITGSLGLTGSFEIESGSTKPFIVNANGQVQLFAHENSYNPTPLLGGIYFTSQSVFFGLED